MVEVATGDGGAGHSSQWERMGHLQGVAVLDEERLSRMMPDVTPPTFRIDFCLPTIGMSVPI